MRHHHKPFGMNCGCPEETVVYPTNYNQVDTCSENTVKHVHPSHTNVVNHHLQKNVHVYPHSTSFANEVDSVNVYGGSFQVPTPPRPNFPVAGAPVPPTGPVPGAPGVPGFPGGFRRRR
ncbi:spore coat protein [Aquibacillus koreensis]|uniref:Spore coat protein n=1 Tax=Aquibacillus koreensis TaxID=279446 RepID=A0A9X3WK47_9BACI|nr:spore coat protein [Aquibacillus koreensis]MCT2537343.1 spore coat protein [Aquibacillus koreensis]MDC3418789.1 spore coat protein [Aquibacillus koreensis]